jgi:hypothetical protein
MSVCKDIHFCVTELLEKHNIKCQKNEEEKIIRSLTQYVEYLIFNMVSVCCMICTTINIRRLQHEHMQYMEKEINKRCNIVKSKKRIGMKGGVFNTAAFYGVQEPQYTEANKMNDIMNVDWQKNIARPELKVSFASQSGGTTTKCSKVNKLILKKIYSVFKFYKVSAKKNVHERFVIMFNKYVDQLFLLLQKSSKILTYTKLHSILSKTKIMKK